MEVIPSLFSFLGFTSQVNLSIFKQKGTDMDLSKNDNLPIKTRPGSSPVDLGSITTRDRYATMAANNHCRCFKCDKIVNDTGAKCGPKPTGTCMEWNSAYWGARLALELVARDLDAPVETSDLAKSEHEKMLAYKTAYEEVCRLFKIGVKQPKVIFEIYEKIKQMRNGRD